jgi:TatD DNase family protein
MSYSDSHCHLDFDAYDADRAAVVARAQAAGLEFILNPGIDLPTSQAAISLAKTYPNFCYALAGFHPNDAQLMDAEAFEKLALLVGEEGVVGIGEIGLDYYRERSSPSVQRDALEKQLALAAAWDLPVCIHNREATGDLLSILHSWWQRLPAQSSLKKKPGVMHAWSENYAEALPFLEMGFKFGVGGPVSFKNASERHAFVSQIALESLVLETDAPFLTPVPFRGRRNEPGYIPYIAEAVSKLKGISPEEVGTIATSNAKNVYRLIRANTQPG